MLEPGHFELWARHLMGRLFYGHPHKETQGHPNIHHIYLDETQNGHGAFQTLEPTNKYKEM